MPKAGVVFHPSYLLHDTGTSHPEKANRLEAILYQLNSSGLSENLVLIEPREATPEELSAVHENDYIISVRDAISCGKTLLDPDTPIGKGSYEAALLAAGGCCSAVDAIMDKKAERIFCAIRPPGHHAGRNYAKGFCIFNNVAIGVQYARKKYGIWKVGIIDWDVHHGNGTQEIFYSDPSVFVISIHQSPLYPGSGSPGESGEGDGSGFNLNIPVLPHTDDEEYLMLFEDAVNGAMRRFQPELIFISAGFDGHSNDPLAQLLLSEEAYRKMTEIVCRISEEHAQGRIISVLEGGYDLTSLARSVETHIKEMMQTSPVIKPAPDSAN